MRIAPSRVLTISVASASARAGGTPIPVSASATDARQQAKASAAEALVDSMAWAQSAVAAATGQPASVPVAASSSVHCFAIAANSAPGEDSSSAARKRGTRDAAYRPAQATASLTTCSLPPGK
jgi:hypothetical protein